MLKHKLYMADSDAPGPNDPNTWDHNLSTEEVVLRVSEQIRHECDGDELTIVVVTDEEDFHQESAAARVDDQLEAAVELANAYGLSARQRLEDAEIRVAERKGGDDA